MNRIAISPAAAGLLRAIIQRADVPGDRILLTHVHSAEWCSLTFSGERHEMHLRVPGADSETTVRKLTDGLADAEFAIPGQIVADIVVMGSPTFSDDGATSITIEALTVCAD